MVVNGYESSDVSEDNLNTLQYFLDERRMKNTIIKRHL